MRNIVHSKSAEETKALGRKWGEEVGAGWVIGLIGDLGAGKTQLVKGLAEGLGIPARILSPTFALVHEYSQGRLPLFHLDLYRLETEAAIRAAGLHEYLQQKTGVTVVEWADRLPELRSIVPGVSIGVHYRWASIALVGENERRISYEDSRP